MANNNQKYGFRLHRGITSAEPSVEAMVVATGYQASPGGVDVDLNVGDPVSRTTDGSAILCSATGAALYGIIVGVKPYWNGTQMTPSNKLVGGTAWGTLEERRSEILVVRADQAIWEIDVDDAVTATTLAAYRALVGENCDHNYDAADATYDRAHPRLDISAHNTTTAMWRIYGVSPTVENQDYSGSFVKLLVVPNEMSTQVAWSSTTGV